MDVPEFGLLPSAWDDHFAVWIGLVEGCTVAIEGSTVRA